MVVMKWRFIVKIKPVIVNWSVDDVVHVMEFPVTKIISHPGEVNDTDLSFAYDKAISFARDLEEKGIIHVYVGWTL